MTLYIIHGWTYTTKYWDKALAALATRSITPKLLHVPGLTTASQKTFTIADYVAWADENLPNNAIALGHSNGGRILMNLAATRPDKLKHLILLNAAGIYHQTPRIKLLRIAAKAFFIFGKIPIFRKILYKVLRVHDYKEAPPNMKKTLDNMIQSDKNLDFSAIKTPTSILWGAKDPTTPLWQGKQIHERIAHSNFKSFADWDHAPYIKHPDQLAEQIQKILNEIDKTNPSTNTKPHTKTNSSAHPKQEPTK